MILFTSSRLVKRMLWRFIRFLGHVGSLILEFSFPRQFGLTPWGSSRLRSIRVFSMIVAHDPQILGLTEMFELGHVKLS